MSASIKYPLLATALAAAALASAAPAAATFDSPLTDGPAQASQPSDDRSEPLITRRDGSRAVPFRVYDSPSSASSDEGFDWADATIGAGAALMAAIALLAGSIAIRRRRGGGPAPVAVDG
jgi:hypothetical protein